MQNPKGASLGTILGAKKKEIARHRKEVPLALLKEVMERQPSPRGFLSALKATSFALIAEVKRSSPSEGILREGDPPSLAARLDRSRATCLSILTDAHFGGNLQHLRLAQSLTAKPLLRKDFILDPYQVYEARGYGADCVLLIATLLGRRELQDLFDLAKELEMDVLVEVHEEEDVAKIPAGADLIGVNNRSLKRGYRTDLTVTEKILSKLPQGAFVISESGVETPEQVAALRNLGVQGVLVGTSLMRAPDPVAKVEELLSPVS